MTHIKNETQYQVVSDRVEELLKIVTNNTPKTDPDFVELDLLSDLLADYDEIYHAIEPPTIADLIREQMAEMNLSQKALAELLGVSPSRVSEYLSGKSEPTLKVAKDLHQKLHIDAELILGVV